MKDKLLLDTFRTIKKSLGKYILLISIVLMGVSFFAGMLSISSAMGQSVDRYADELDLFDFQIFSNYGFDEDDIETLNNINENFIIEAGHLYDVEASFGENDYIFRVESFDEDAKLNKVELVEGKYPSSANEILVEMPNDLFDVPTIGEIITIKRTTTEHEEVFDITEFTVVGVVSTPNYMSLEKGASTLDNLMLNSFLYIPEEAFLSDHYTTVYMGSQEGQKLNSFNEEYAELIEREKMLIESVSDEAQLVRGDKIKEEAQKEYNDGLTEYKEAVTDFDREIKDAQDEIDKGYKELEEAREDVPIGMLDPETLKKIEMELDLIETELEEAQKELNTARETGQKELDEAFAELKEAKEEIDNLDEGEWTILTRDMHYPMLTYKDTVKQMQVIGLIFPIFFFLVAALVCLTTMKRMVDEQRGQVGILRALGYSRFKCASKYLVYALSATLIGGIVGVVVGIMLFPPIVYGTWNIMYNLPTLNYDMPWFNMIIAIVIFLVLMGVTTYSSIRVETLEVTSDLLRPKAPVAGKKVFLEKIPFVWKRFSFTAKITARNLIRYKQRFFMSVIGIAGCTCLLVSGFGMQTSISGIAEIQYNELTLHDGMISTVESTEETEKVVNSIEDIDETFVLQPISTYATEITIGEEEEVAYVQVYEDDTSLKEMNTVRSRNEGKELILENDTILISEKLSELLNVEIGDEIAIQSKNEVLETAVVGGIYEKYINHEIFISAEYYERLFNEKAEKNAILVIGDLDSELIREQITDFENVKGITLNNSVISSFENISTSMNIVVAVIIISAASLAFVVLGNLTSINISERKREIATLKVLGFKHRETKDYIFNENMVLTIFGILVGVFLGILAHAFIIMQVEMGFLMFARTITIESIIYSVLLTLIFSIIVNRVMLARLKNIDMIESLKSVE